MIFLQDAPEPSSYFVNLDRAAFTFANPNLSAVLAFLKTNEEIVIVPVLMFLAAVLIFTAIWRNTRPETKDAICEEEERAYVVKNGGGVVVFSIDAFDVEFLAGKRGQQYLNFLGRFDAESEGRPTLALFPWDEKVSVSSAAKKKAVKA